MLCCIFTVPSNWLPARYFILIFIHPIPIPVSMEHGASAASSSSSMTSPTSTSYAHYDVFINHRGEVKKTFASRLYRSLHFYGLKAFLDQPEMQVGHPIPSQIEAAIRKASVHVAIFSPAYAESEWCLDELVLMEKSGATIIPVFYNVKPSELRWTGREKNGQYAKALRTHEEKQRFNTQRIENWRDALSNVSNISGLELEAFNRDEEELLDKVVQSVLKKIPKTPLIVAKYPTGLEAKLQDFEREVLSHKEKERLEVKVVGIVGLGGVGKTTLATDFFNRKRSHYSEFSFLIDVREHSGRKMLNSLQSKLIKDLKYIDVNIERWEEGIGILEKHLLSCHALIIFDDVGHGDLDAFLPIMRVVLDPKSLILATSRDRHALKSAGIPESSIYQLTGLDTPHSKELFCKHAFFEPHPLRGFENLVDGFVKASCGLPLSLKVFGALVCGEDQSYWEDYLNGLNNGLPEEIGERLKISYKSLNREEKEIFLDIACFSIGEDRDKWIRIWAGSGWKGLVGFRNLQNKCLVEVGSENEIRMHDHLRDLGRNIAEEGSMLLRLRGATTQNINDLLEEKCAERTQVRGIRMAPGSSLTDTCDDRLFGSDSSSDRGFVISKVQLLEAEGNFLESIWGRVRSPKLIWLRWHECPCTALPSWLPMRDLRVLEVNGRELKRLWQSESQAPMKLRELNINAPLLKFPSSLGKLEHLEKLVAEETYLGTLPKEFCYLPCLKYLKLKDYKMEFFPNAGGKVTNLQLSQGIGLQNLPVSMGNLSNLQITDLHQCRSLEMLLTIIAWRRSQIPPGI